MDLISSECRVTYDQSTILYVLPHFLSPNSFPILFLQLDDTVQGLLRRYDGDCGQPPEEPKLDTTGAELESVSVLGQEGLERRGKLGFLHWRIGQD